MVYRVMAILCFGTFAIGGEYFYIHKGEKVFLTPLSQTVLRSNETASPMKFKDPKGVEIAIPNRLVVKLKEKEDLGVIVENYQLKVLRKYDGNLFLLEASSPETALKISNALSREPFVLYAEPDIIKRWKLR